MNGQTTNIIQYDHLKLLKKLNNLFDENESMRIKEIFNKQLEAEATINDCVERIEKERAKLRAAEETETILKIEGSNFSELAEAFKSGDFKTLFRLIGVLDKITENIKEFESRYDPTLTRTIRETEMRNKNINDLMSRKTSAETNLEQSKIHYDEEINNQKYVKNALDNPDSKEHLIKALERFASNEPKLGFSSEEISVIAMIVMFPEQYGLTLNDIKKILFSQVESELKNSISDIFAMNKNVAKKEDAKPKVDEKLVRSKRMDYSKIDAVKEKTDVKSVEEILKNASLEMNNEELELAKASNNQENILNILKYTSKKGVTPSCFKYNVADLINANFEEFKKISDDLLNKYKRPMEDVETIFGNILSFDYQMFNDVYNDKGNLSDILYKSVKKDMKTDLEPKVSRTAQFIEDDTNQKAYLNDLDKEIETVLKFPGEVEEIDPLILEDEGKGMGMSA